MRLFVHLAAPGPGTGSGTGSGTGRADVCPVARVEGLAPVTADWVRHTLGPRCRFTITTVRDPLDQTPVDAYEIPTRHRNAVHALTPADVFPFAGSVDRSILQIDHTVARQPSGPDSPEGAGADPPGGSHIGNDGPLTGVHHRIKTHGRWTVRQPYPGLYVWRDPYGAHYLVDHTGTR